MHNMDYKKNDILFVDDEVGNLKTFQFNYKKTFNIKTAINGKEALRILNENCRIALVIADQRMPEITGIELLRIVKDNYPDIIRFMVTGYSDITVCIDGINKGEIYRYIQKPWNITEFEMEIKRGLERYSYIKESLQLHRVLIYGFSRLADLKDKETGAHLIRLKNYVTLLTDELKKMGKFSNIDEFFASNVPDLSILHDIGKIGIPDKILLKPGKLTNEEFDIMRNHTVIGRDVLLHADELKDNMFLQMGSSIAYNHHEKYNGAGYPRGIKGNQIPLEARIVALADAYDAITSTRSYESRRSHEEAIQRIVNDRGKHFDTDVVSAFLQSQNTFDEFRLEYRDELYQDPFKEKLMKIHNIKPSDVIKSNN